ncbi:mitochondrial E3 ubiquitin protein ligase 1a S homeolog [Xenopus laevis]|uniref:RING-type E3 ubiquitin transferase n=1 Tax=Xenopus laevis TaxID=8355 RepID=Q6AX71_XENLA|nr:mitochondrial E3 ubiquitin protein ligase 1a S homeolog [Xenopus laevis]AAH79729.1 MGC83539 protein [Xenopus laevis]
MVMELSAVDTLCVGSTCALSSLFYYLYRCQRAAVTRIQSAQRLQFDSDLKKLLEHSESRELGYVVLEGKVQAVNEALKSHFKPHLQAVIQRYQMTEHRLLWNSLTRSWSEGKHIIHKQVDAIPFLLSQLEGVGDSVLVSNPLNASGLCLETVHEEFHIPSPGFGEVFRHYLSGEKPTGLLETEEILPVGTVITGIGRLVLDPQGGVDITSTPGWIRILPVP